MQRSVDGALRVRHQVLSCGCVGRLRRERDWGYERVLIWVGNPIAWVVRAAG